SLIVPRTRRLVVEATVSLRDAKANLSRLTRQAQEGTRVVITSHRTPVADLVPHGAGMASAHDIKHPGPLPRPIRLKGIGPTASDLVLMDRDG
ncbi:MAG TPA: type II toxin-antitoxin system prevent-host-death family antitoxin, partial [Thermoanaerobaculia bacterium]|nr:type II toxin-antitoxin system prevent-host-death family antitoxin [Thermoanaerobaculia bacterium]